MYDSGSTKEVAPMNDARIIQRPNVLVSLKNNKRKLEEELKQLNEAIQALEDHPEIEHVLSLLAKVGRY